MKFLSILAAASLALAPAIASAGSDVGSSDDGRPISGPLAGRTLADSAIPVEALVIGGLIIFGGAVIAIVAGDSNNKTNK